MNPIISVIVPVYNAEKTIQRCVESVLDQTFFSFELILVDDGSTDSSGKQCDHYSEIDERIKVFHQENKGVSEARNLGLAQAVGLFVFFLDSDDELYPETLEKNLELIQLYEADALLGSLEIIYGASTNIAGFKNENCYGKNIWEDICLNSRPFGWAGGKMFKRDIIRGINFNKDMFSQEDLDFNLEVFNQCSSIVTTPIIGYRYHFFNSQREPRIIDYISNQLKLYDYAEMNYHISDKARKAVLERIASLAYTVLYNSTTKDEYNNLATKISNLQALGKHSGEFKSLKVKHAIFMERIIKKDYFSTYVYCRVRKKIVKSMRSLNDGKDK